ncbi:sensor histidine kinase [Parvularcula marina]|uniref:sensor histidine kinase n=1 Tax=Parvularcula marina TaxID=2292771 RepID=UPI003518CA11
MPSSNVAPAAIDPVSARFKDKDLERAYRKFALAQGGRLDQLLMISGAFIHLGYGILDWIVLGDLAPFTVTLRLISFPFLLALFALTFTPWGYRNMMWITVAIVAIVSVSFAGIIAAIGSNTPPYYVGLIQLAVQFSAVARLNFRVCAGLLSFMTITLVIATHGFAPGPDLLAGQVMVVSIFLGAAAGNYFLERNRRKEFMTYREREHYFAQVLEMAEDAERSVDRKNALLNVLGHVVKTPLHQIIGYAQIIEQTDQPDGPGDETRSFASEIYRAGTSLSHQSQRLLDYSRADAGLLPASPQMTTPTRVVREAIYRHQSPAETKRITLNLECGEENIFVDPRHMTRALDELIDNAVRYCPPGSTITISSEVTSIGDIISIRDDGPGITNSNFDLAGEALRQVEDVRKLGGDKLGIGVSLSRTLTRIAGGKLYICSIPDHGCLAQIVIPPATEGVAAAQPKTAA